MLTLDSTVMILSRWIEPTVHDMKCWKITFDFGLILQHLI